MSSHTGNKVGVMLKGFTHWQQSEGDVKVFTHWQQSGGDAKGPHTPWQQSEGDAKGRHTLATK